LARPDLEVRMPTDEQADATEAGRDEGYGRVVVHAGGGTRETRSTSRREIVSLIFEAAGYQLPDWSPPEYPGYPLVVAVGRRRARGRPGGGARRHGRRLRVAAGDTVREPRRPSAAALRRALRRVPRRREGVRLLPARRLQG